MMKRPATSLAFALAVLVLTTPIGVLADGPFTGTWSSTATGDGPNADQTARITLTLTEANGTVTGAFYNGTATLTGVRHGNVVTGTYKTGTFSEQTGSGFFVFTLSDDGKTFKGTWGVNPGEVDGEWNGTLQ
jgi:hypothetical protein